MNKHSNRRAWKQGASVFCSRFYFSCLTFAFWVFSFRSGSFLPTPFRPFSFFNLSASPTSLFSQQLRRRFCIITHFSLPHLAPIRNYPTRKLHTPERAQCSFLSWQLDRNRLSKKNLSATLNGSACIAPSNRRSCAIPSRHTVHNRHEKNNGLRHR